MGKSKKNRQHHRVRIIWLERPDKVILLATNLACEDAETLVVAEMYRQRWQIELFFWWLKKIVKAGHWFAQSEKGRNKPSLARWARDASVCSDHKASPRSKGNPWHGLPQGHRRARMDRLNC